MEQIKLSNKRSSQSPHLLYLSDKLSLVDGMPAYAAKFIEEGKDKNFLSFSGDKGIIATIKAEESLEKCRRAGHQFFQYAKNENIWNWNLEGKASEEQKLAFLEGLALSTYTFNKYKSKKEEQTIHIHADGMDESKLKELGSVVAATCIARTLVNEPHCFLNAMQYSKEIKSLAKTFGFSLKVWDKEKITKEKMGGILGVNRGSIQEPTFNILEYKPSHAVNKQAIVLVGKGVMYDTGGLSLKPTPNSMDMMKSDMGGSAAVVGAFCAVAAQKLPIHLVGLIPATDNRPGLDAIAPGDVLTMYSGKTVEVLNTDAEGRLVLADALHYAKRLKPELVMDFATLTGAAARALGPQGIACMGNAPETTKDALKTSGQAVHERLLEFPMWEEYESMLKSEIADINNLGGPVAGQTTAGMFLQHFVDYPWMHFDIAGMAFLQKPDSYRGNNGTGVGVRLLYNFLKNRSQA